MHIKLSPRLRAIADMVDYGASVIDIGTDHGYIPVYLAQKRQVLHIAASDINEDPLARARLSAAEHGVSDKITFMLCNGLQGFASYSADTIITAGMGGENISNILRQAPWTNSPGISLILQPMTKVHNLRQYLMGSGYTIEKEILVRDTGKIYPVMKVLGGGEKISSPAYAEIYLGKISKAHELFDEYKNSIMLKLTKAAKGMQKSENNNSALFAEITEALKEISAV